MAKAAARVALSENARTAGEVCTDLVVTHAIDGLINTSAISRHDLAAGVVEQMTASFVATLGDEILSEAQWAETTTIVARLHLLCSICTEILKSVDALRQLGDLTATHVADKIVSVVSDQGLIDAAVRAVLRKALVRAFTAAIDILADPAKIELLRLAGLTFCPDISEHKDVERHCVVPLFGGIISDEVGQWVLDGFQPHASVLLGPRTRSR